MGFNRDLVFFQFVVGAYFGWFAIAMLFTVSEVLYSRPFLKYLKLETSNLDARRSEVMKKPIEIQQGRAEAIQDLAGYLLSSESGVISSLAERIIELAALVQEDLQIALDSEPFGTISCCDDSTSGSRGSEYINVRCRNE